jgi:hypothetical protein
LRRSLPGPVFDRDEQVALAGSAGGLRLVRRVCGDMYAGRIGVAAASGCLNSGEWRFFACLKS